MSENRPLNESSRTATEKSENRDRPQIRHRVRRAPPAPTHSSADEPTSSQPIEQPSAYAVGYGRPPKHTRFKPGTSGNPRGRPKSAQGLNTLARKVMTEKVLVRTASGEKKIPRIQALLLKALDLALKGNPRAQSQMLTLYAAAVPEVSVNDAAAGAEELTTTDLATLQELKEILLHQESEQ